MAQTCMLLHILPYRVVGDFDLLFVSRSQKASCRMVFADVYVEKPAYMKQVLATFSIRVVRVTKSCWRLH
jgi:hypothetical protein